MELNNEFEVSAPIDKTWAVLTDVERIAPCLPGAQLQEVEGDEYRGIVKVKVGPITAQYKGAATFVEQDDANHRAVLKAEGEIDGGELEDALTELLWGRAFAAFWDRQLGVRYDTGAGPNREWLAFGVQGLAPYWFEIEATAYLGEAGRSALRFDTSYDLPLTQKLVLQPRLEANAYGESDAERGLGSGLSDASLALRVRYEIRRELAPYFGIEWVRKYGGTEDFARAAGDDPNDTRFVAGLRVWF